MIEKILRTTVGALRRHPTSHVLASASWYLAAMLGGVRIGTLTTGEPMVLNLGDFIQRNIFIYGTHEAYATKYLRSIARPGWTFIDVGSCEGYYAVLAASLGGEGSRVVAVEPNPTLVAQLQRTADLGGYKIQIVAAGCGSEPGQLSLTISDVKGNVGMSSFVETKRGTRTAEVPVRTLDDMCEELALRPDVVKIDVESMELEVLRGFQETLRGESRPPVILVELAPRSAPHASALAFLLGLGYSAARILDDGSTTPLASLDELPTDDVLVAFRPSA